MVLRWSCGRLTSLTGVLQRRAPIVPSKGDLNVPYVFVVLQFVNWNSTLFRALSEAMPVVPEA